MKTIHLLFTSILCLGITACKIGDDDSANHKIYGFAQDVSLSNVKKEYTTGDILWMEINNSGKTFTDLVTGENVEVSNATFVFYLDVLNPFAAYTPDEKFGLVKQTGKVLEDKDFPDKGLASFSFGCPESNYAFKAGIQFLKTGTYFVWLNNVAAPPQIFFTASGNCSIQNQFPPPSDAAFASVTFSFGVSDTNLDKFMEYLGANPDPSVDTIKLKQALTSKQAFFVWVK